MTDLLNKVKFTRLPEYFQKAVGFETYNRLQHFKEYRELLDFTEADNLEFAARKPKAPKIGTKITQKGGRVITCDPAKTYPCGNVCRGQDKPCKNPIEGQAKTYAEFLKLQPKTNSKTPLGKSDKTMDTGKNKPVKQGETGMSSGDRKQEKVQEFAKTTLEAIQKTSEFKELKNLMSGYKNRDGSLKNSDPEWVLRFPHFDVNNDKVGKRVNELQKQLQSKFNLHPIGDSNSFNRFKWEKTFDSSTEVKDTVKQGETVETKKLTKNGYETKEIKLAVPKGELDRIVQAQVKGSVAVHEDKSGLVVSDANSGFKIHDFFGYSKSEAKKKANQLVESLQDVDFTKKLTPGDALKIKSKILSVELGISEDDATKLAEENKGVDIWRIKLKHDLGSKKKRTPAKPEKETATIPDEKTKTEPKKPLSEYGLRGKITELSKENETQELEDFINSTSKNHQTIYIGKDGSTSDAPKVIRAKDANPKNDKKLTKKQESEELKQIASSNEINVDSGIAYVKTPDGKFYKQEKGSKTLKPVTADEIREKGFGVEIKQTNGDTDKTAPEKETKSVASKSGEERSRSTTRTPKPVEVDDKKTKEILGKSKLTRSDFSYLRQTNPDFNAKFDDWLEKSSSTPAKTKALKDKYGDKASAVDIFIKEHSMSDIKKIIRPESEAPKTSTSKPKEKTETQLKAESNAVETLYQKGLKSGETPTKVTDLAPGDKVVHYYKGADGKPVRSLYEYDGDYRVREINKDGTKSSQFYIGDGKNNEGKLVRPVGEEARKSEVKQAADGDTKPAASKSSEERSLATSSTPAKKITTFKSLQDESQANGVTAEKIRGGYYLSVDDKPLFNLNRGAGDIKTASQALSDYKLLKDNGIDPQKYSQPDVQNLLDKVTLKEWGVRAPTDKDFVSNFYTKNHYLADVLPGVIRASKALKEGDYDNLSPQDLLALSKRSDGLKQKVAEPFSDNTIFQDTEKLDNLVKTYLPEKHNSREWQDNKAYNSKVFGETANDRMKTFETIAAKMYIDKMRRTKPNFSEFTWIRENIEHYKAIVESQKLGNKTLTLINR